VKKFDKWARAKIYIGSAVDLRRRLKQYFNVNYLKRHTDMLISRALLKYGYSNFNLEILEYCPVSKLLKRENYYFKMFKPEYNISQVAGAPMFGRNHSEKTRAKMSAFRLGYIKTPSVLCMKLFGRSLLL
jgi:group I intron endonuclease